MSQAAIFAGVAIGAGVAKGVFSILEGIEKEKDFIFQAEQEKLQGEQAKLNAQGEANQMRQELINAMGSLSATFGTRGITQEGTAVTEMDVVRREAAEGIRQILRQGRFGKRAGLIQASQLRRAGRAARTRGYVKGGLSLLEAGVKAKEIS